MWEIALSGMVFAIMLAVLYVRIQPTLISPIYSLVTIYLLVFVGGSLAYDAEYSPAWFLTPTVSEIQTMVSRMLWMLSFFMGGALLVTAFSKRQQTLRCSMQTMAGLQLSPMQIKIGFILASTCIALTVFAYGPATLWYSEEYLAQTNLVATTISSVLSLASALLLGCIAGQGTRRQKELALILQALLLVLMAAIATRRLALLPLLFCLGALVGKPGSCRWRAVLLIVLILTPSVMMIPLTTRGMGSMGISTLGRIPTLLMHWDLEWQIRTAVNNILVSLPTTIESAKQTASDPISYVLTGINPLPGSWTNWYQDQMRINVYIPFNAIGDLLRAGVSVAFAYYAIIGAYFARIELRVKSEGRLGPELLICLGLCFAFIVFSLQYPLRTTTRMIYYMMAIELILRVVSKLRLLAGSQRRLILPKPFAARD